jgi:putative membrane-bound dehydrogenase-like protein
VIYVIETTRRIAYFSLLMEGQFQQLLNDETGAVQLGYPTSVMPWKKGVLVTCAPEIFYAEDSNGDGKADRREVLFTGFVEGNQQHRVNGLRWGLDGWVYCANGDSGGQIASAKTGTAVDIGGRDFRIHPDTGELDPQTGMTQFGRCRDDWGNWFGGNSGYPFWHCALADHYTRRNPNAAPPDPRVYLMDPPLFASVFPISRTLPRFNAPDTADRFTSACGAGIYRDELFGPNFSASYFVCEPVHNLVHHEVMSPKGVTFTGSRPAGREKAEFLASSDNWFRPTQVRTGPDGALGWSTCIASSSNIPSGFPRIGSRGSTCVPATTRVAFTASIRCTRGPEQSRLSIDWTRRRWPQYWRAPTVHNAI